MLSFPVLVAAACSGGGGTGATVTSDAASTSAVSTSAGSPGAGTNDAGTTGTDTTGVGATGSGTSGTTAAEVSATSTTATSTPSASASGTDLGAMSSGSATTIGAVSTGTTASTSGEAALSFALDIFPLWEMVREPAWQYRGTGSYSGCNVDGVCHGGASPGAGLIMADAPSTYAELIDVPSASTLCDGTLRVVAGDPETSCLVLFYQGRLGSDDLGWVDDAEIELMREWIRQGALP